MALPPDCFGPVTHPEALLRELRATFDIQLLQDAGVVDLGCDGAWRIAPPLVNPAGALVPLRTAPVADPFALLTARGCLPRSWVPVEAVMFDVWTKARMKQIRVLVATQSIHELVLLRALDLPATLTIGICRLRAAELIALDTVFAGDEVVNLYDEVMRADIDRVNKETPQRNGQATVAVDANDRDKADSNSNKNRRMESVLTVPEPASTPDLSPTLALVAWSPRHVSARIDPTVRRAVEVLEECCEYLAIDLAGIRVWQPDQDWFDRFQFLIRRGEIARLRDEIVASLDDLHDRAELLDRSDNSAPAVDAHPRSDAQSRDEAVAAVQRDLVPWALASLDADVRAAGLILSDLATMLHSMGRTVIANLGGPSGIGDTRSLREYATLIHRFASLARDLNDRRRWRC